MECRLSDKGHSGGESRASWTLWFLCVGFFMLHMPIGRNSSSIARIHMTTNFYGHKSASKYIWDYSAYVHTGKHTEFGTVEDFLDRFSNKFKTNIFSRNCKTEGYMVYSAHRLLLRETIKIHKIIYEMYGYHICY